VHPGAVSKVVCKYGGVVPGGRQACAGGTQVGGRQARAGMVVVCGSVPTSREDCRQWQWQAEQVVQVAGKVAGRQVEVASGTVLRGKRSQAAGPRNAEETG